MRVLYPRYPQLYGLPKIHKTGAPIRPIVSFYNTPLSALHKVLSTFLKPLTNSCLRLKDSTALMQHLDTTYSPTHPYHASLDVVSLYTSCDMRAARDIAIDKFNVDPSLLPDNISVNTISSLINFCLDNSYFEYDNTFYSQNSGGPMGSPLTVELAEIRTSYIEELALNTSPDPPNSYRHFVDDGLGDFRDRQHAETYLLFINSLSSDLQYTLEHPADDGSLPFLDVLIHPDKSTSVYRKPTHTNLYLKYNSSTNNATKDSVIRSLTRRAYNLCSPQHLDAELTTVYNICLSNGFPPQRTTTIMEQVKTKMERRTTNLSHRQFKKLLNNDRSLKVSLPYHPTVGKPLKSLLNKHDIDVTYSSSPNLRSLLTLSLIHI